MVEMQQKPKSRDPHHTEGTEANKRRGNGKRRERKKRGSSLEPKCQYYAGDPVSKVQGNWEKSGRTNKGQLG
jgi:hypothetical protein